MQNKSQSKFTSPPTSHATSHAKSPCVVVLGTGGTIAGTAPEGEPDHRYVAAQLSVAELLSGVPGLAEAARGHKVEAEQVAQLDSKDMDFSVWRDLVARLDVHLARPDVVGVVVTHGTDTLEETAYFLHRVLQPSKPVVLTAAMRPATSVDADGPRHLRQALSAVVAQPPWQGVAVVLQGEVHDAAMVRKVHPRAMRAFASGEGGPAARWHDDAAAWHWHRPLAAPAPWAGSREDLSRADWPWVEVLHSHIGARADAVSSWCAAGVAGIVVVATGNGTVHHALQAALQQAQAAGVQVVRCTRCPNAGLLEAGQGADEDPWCPTSALPPAHTRIALTLALLAPEVQPDWAAGRT